MLNPAHRTSQKPETGDTEEVMRILIVEDDKEAASYLAKAFREAGHVVDHAADGEEGYDLATSAPYDVLVVDRMLPRRDGLSLISGLRAEGHHTPVLVLSALGQVDDRVTGLRAGGDDYLPKPYAFPSCWPGWRRSGVGHASARSRPATRSAT